VDRVQEAHRKRNRAQLLEERDCIHSTPQTRQEDSIGGHTMIVINLTMALVPERAALGLTVFDRTILLGPESRASVHIVLKLGACLLGLLALACGSSDAVGVCRCPPSGRGATIDLGCVPDAVPVVKTSGPCFACNADGSTPDGGRCTLSFGASDFHVSRTGAGTCHLEVTFANGATSQLDVDFVSQWRACGSDPHGCGEDFVPITPSGSMGRLSLPAPECSAGVDAGL
jgi:hypothetical protein